MDGKSCLQRYFYSPISGLSATTGYAKDNLPTRYQISSVSHVDYSYDKIARLTQKSLTTGSASLYTDYTYKQSARGGNYTTHLIETELLANDGYQYTYNLMGNITAVKTGTRANMSALSDYRAYTYDAKGELTGETIYSGGSSTSKTYAYDGLGNITSQTQTGVLGNKSISYTYGTSSSAGWGKMLNSVSITQDGNTTTENIVYDQIGNPTTYRGAAMTWFGRQLTAYSKSGTTASFTYDSDGLRGKKTVNGTTSTYQYVNGHLAYEKRGNVQYFYFYDSFGKLSSIRFYDPSVSNGSAQNYFTLTNQQGDVVAIYNVAGTKVASYEYDAWGNILSTTDTSGVNIATRNPFRYRGYYYDEETGLYYLQSRYYDPEIGRFLNADGYVSTGQGVLGHNMFAYCGNNPVNSVDHTGQFWSEIWEFAKIAVAEIGKAMGVMSPAYAGCGGAAVADGPLPFGDIVAVVGVALLTVGAIGYGIYQAAQAPAISISKAEEKAEVLPAPPPTSTEIYRYGGTNPGNLTPKAKDKFTGLSFSTVPMPGAAKTTIEALNATGVVYAVQDGPTHVSVRPVGEPMEAWINAGSGSIWTQAVQSVVIKWDGGY